MEQIVIELEKIHMQFLDKEILNIERLAVHQFDRIGIVGKNGSGKSTLMKILHGVLKPTKGTIRRHVSSSYFRQVESPIIAEVDQGYAGKLRVSEDQVYLSGGEETRLKLAQLFSQYKEVLIIDEPTTHLDREGISFFLDELRYYYGALILVSHDRAVLNELVTTIWEVDHGKVNVYEGNYDKYIEQKQLEKKQHKESYEKYIKEKLRLERAAQEKFKKAQKITQASKMSKKETKAKPNRMFETKSKGTSRKSIERAAKAIESRLHQLDGIEAVTEQRSITFHQSKTVELYNKFPIMADRFNLSIGGQQLLHEVSFQVPLGKKLALTGSNGVGKTTLLEAIANKNEQLILSPKIKIGYFKQMGYQFKTDETVWDFIKKHSTHEASFLRTVLHTMQFSGTDFKKSVQTLSGGEAVRLQLCELFLGEYNTLLLDEATNFLDIETVEALEIFIHGYKGTIIFISHDEQFVKNCANIVWKIEDKKIIPC